MADEEEAENQVSRPQQPNPAFAFESRFANDEISDEEESGQDFDGEYGWQDDGEEEVVEEVEVVPNDRAIVNRFNPEFDPNLILRHYCNQSLQQRKKSMERMWQISYWRRLLRTKQLKATKREIIVRGAPEDAVELPAKVVEVDTQYV